MLPFYGLFLIWALGAIQFSSPVNRKQENLLFLIAFVATALMVGLRYEVGGDWETYLQMYDLMYFQPLSFNLKITDPAYGFLNWVSARFNGGLWPINLVCGSVLIAGLSALAKRQVNSWLAMTTATPYLIIVVGMGYTRQAAAIGVICWTISQANRDRLVRTIGGILVAALFHKTAILFLPILLAPALARRPVHAAIGVVTFVAIGLVVLGGDADKLVTNYVSSDYQSSGAALRVSMNVVAGLIFLTFKDKYQMSRYIKHVWTICSYLSLLSLLALVNSASSVGVDRLALFLIPLQVVTFAGLPYALSKRGGAPAPSLLLGVIGYNFIVEYVYFTFADFSWAWVPYQNILFSDTTIHRL